MVQSRETECITDGRKYDKGNKSHFEVSWYQVTVILWVLCGSCDIVDGSAAGQAPLVFHRIQREPARLRGSEAVGFEHLMKVLGLHELVVAVRALGHPAKHVLGQFNR